MPADVTDAQPQAFPGQTNPADQATPAPPPDGGFPIRGPGEIAVFKQGRADGAPLHGNPGEDTIENRLTAAAAKNGVKNYSPDITPQEEAYLVTRGFKSRAVPLGPVNPEYTTPDVGMEGWTRAVQHGIENTVDQTWDMAGSAGRFLEKTVTDPNEARAMLMRGISGIGQQAQSLVESLNPFLPINDPRRIGNEFLNDPVGAFNKLLMIFGTVEGAANAVEALRSGGAATAAETLEGLPPDPAAGQPGAGAAAKIRAELEQEMSGAPGAPSLGQVTQDAQTAGVNVEAPGTQRPAASEEFSLEDDLRNDPDPIRLFNTLWRHGVPDIEALSIAHQTNALQATLERLNYAPSLKPGETAPPLEKPPVVPPIGSVPQATAGPFKYGNDTKVFMVPHNDLTLKPDVMQYKGDVGKGGVDNTLFGAKTWDDSQAGIMDVWQDPSDGSLVVVNGHQRFGLADRLDPNGINHRVQFLDAATAQEARIQGALRNIREGSGTPVDAARIFRETGATKAGLEAQGVSFTKQIAKDGLALSVLPDSVWNRVLSKAFGEKSDYIGSLIGQSGLSPDNMELMAQDIQKDTEKGNAVTAMGAYDLAQGIKAQAQGSFVTGDIFGEHTEERALTPEKAKVITNLKGMFKKTAVGFKALTAADRVSLLESIGGSIDVGAATDAGKFAAAIAQVIDKTGWQAGSPLSELLDTAAQRVASGEDPKPVAESISKDAQAAVVDWIKSNTRGAQAAAKAAPKATAKPIAPTYQEYVRQQITSKPSTLTPEYMDQYGRDLLGSGSAPSFSTDRSFGETTNTYRIPGKGVLRVKLEGRDPAHITEFYVTPEARGSAVAKNLLMRMKKDIGIPAIDIDSMTQQMQDLVSKHLPDAEYFRAGNGTKPPVMLRDEYRNLYPEAPKPTEAPTAAPGSPETQGTPFAIRRTLGGFTSVDGTKVDLQEPSVADRTFFVTENPSPANPTLRFEVYDAATGIKIGDGPNPLDATKDAAQAVRRRSTLPENGSPGSLAGELAREEKANPAPRQAAGAAGPGSPEANTEPLAPVPGQVRETNPESGAIGLNELTGGVVPFVEQDVVPTAQAAVQTAKDMADSLHALTDPASRGQLARDTANIARPAASRGQRQVDMATTELRPKLPLPKAVQAFFTRGDRLQAAQVGVGRFFDAMPQLTTKDLATLRERIDGGMPRNSPDLFEGLVGRKQIEFYDRMERGLPQDTPELDRIAAQLRRVSDEGWARAQSAPNGPDGGIENYLAHLYKEPNKFSNWLTEKANQNKAIGQILGKRSLIGKASFLNQRTMPTMVDAIARGLVPLTTNPVDAILLKRYETERFVSGQTIFGEMKDRGIAVFSRLPKGPGSDANPYLENPVASQTTPVQWVKINDSVAQSTYRNEDGEHVLAGHYWAPEPAAKIINNYLSPGLRGYPGVKPWMASQNMLNAAQLGLSAFHAGFTGFNAYLTALSVGSQQISRGEIGAGARSIIASPLAPIRYAKVGSAMGKEWDIPGSHPALAPDVDRFIMGGGRAHQDLMYQTQMAKSFTQALKSGNYPGAVLRALPAGVETLAAPVMQYLVPAMKRGAWKDMMDADLPHLNRLYPNGIPAEVMQEASARNWDSVENRMGQVTYDNIFWNKAVKDAMHMATRSLGWNFGTFREGLGSVADTANAATGKRQPWEKGLSPRQAYVAIGLPFGTAMAGAFYQYLRTGKGPASIEDYFFPRTGEKDSMGNDKRMNLPSYVGDVQSYRHNWSATLGSKLGPILQMGNDLAPWKNSDFYGVQVRDPDAPLVDQAKQVGGYVAQQFTPFSIRNMAQGTTLGNKIGPFVGIRPAPSYLNKTAAQNRMSDFEEANNRQGLKTPDQAAVENAKSALRAAIREGVDVTPQLTKLMEVGAITPAQAKMVYRTGEADPMAAGFVTLKPAQAIDVFNKTVPGQDREQVFPMLQSHFAPKVSADQTSFKFSAAATQFLDNLSPKTQEDFFSYLGQPDDRRWPFLFQRIQQEERGWKQKVTNEAHRTAIGLRR